MKKMSYLMLFAILFLAILEDILVPRRHLRQYHAVIMMRQSILEKFSRIRRLMTVSIEMKIQILKAWQQIIQKPHQQCPFQSTNRIRFYTMEMCHNIHLYTLVVYHSFHLTYRVKQFLLMTVSKTSC